MDYRNLLSIFEFMLLIFCVGAWLIFFKLKSTIFLVQQENPKKIVKIMLHNNGTMKGRITRKISKNKPATRARWTSFRVLLWDFISRCLIAFLILSIIHTP